MKTIYKKILLICLVLFSISKIKAQTSCVTAIPLSYTMNYSAASYTNTEFWFTTTVNPGGIQIAITTTSGSTGKFTKADIYDGNCSTFLKTDSLYNSTDTTFNVTLTDTISHTYYIKLTNVGGSSNLNLKTSSGAIVFIIGDLGFCSGQSITLSTVVLGQGTSPSYTWQPGNVNTASVTATPTATTTYTLTYKDIQFGVYQTVTQTVTVTQLSAAMCKNCEMVQNGAMENTQWCHYSTNNILLPTTSCAIGQGGNNGPKSDPKFWKAATCATPDYFSTSFHNTQSGVPINAFSGSPGTNAHSGQGYGGLYTFNASSGWKEYLSSQLKCPLITGVLYNVSFYASLSRGGGTWLANTPSNNIGLYLSSSTYTSTTTSNLSATPQLNYSSSLNNAGSWTQVAGTITGNGEQYVTIGNFFSDLNTIPYYGSTASSYYYLDDISITPATPTVTAGSCQSGSVTITALGAPNSTITTWAGPASYTASGNVITVTSPTAAATYTCMVNLSACPGCSNVTQTITINPATTCSASASPATSPTVTPYTFSSSPGYSSSDITVNPGINYIITSTDLRMAAGKSITVKNGGTLTIQGAWIHGCNECTSTNMWQGIIVENGGTVVMTTRNILLTFYGNIIEDAIQAVSTAINSATTPIPNWSITSIIFNNCSTGVYVGTHPGDLSGNTIDNTLFTCRKIGNHSVALTNITSIRNDVLASTPSLHQSASNPIDFTIAGARSKYGIQLNSVGSVTTAINVGSSSSSANIFDNLDYGIYDISTSLTAKNNIFQNLTGNSYNYPTSLPTGVGIYGDASASCWFGPCALDAVLIVGNNNTTIDNTEKNSFTNCLGGILLNKFRQVYINNNTFDNETTATTFTTSGSLVTGQNAVTNLNYGFTTIGGGGPTEKMQFANNNVKNYSYGYFLDFLTPTNTNAGSSSGNGYIYNNTISATGSNYCNYGLYLQQSSATTPSVSIPQNAIDITANTITSMSKNAVSVNSVNTSSATTGFIQIRENTELSVKYKSGAVSSDKISAIRLENSYRTQINDNTTLKVTGLTGTYPSTLAQYLGGVNVYLSPNTKVYCNTALNIGEGFTWENANAGSVWKNNYMTNSRYGLVLRSSGVMGDQGSSGNPINDVFYTNISSAHTLCDGSNPGSGTTSKLYTTAPTCTASLTYQPCSNNQILGTAYTASGGTVTLVSASGPGTYSCIAGGGGGGQRMLGSSTAGGVIIHDQQDSLRAELDSMIMSNIPYPTYDYETHWAMQYYVNSADTGVHVMQGYDNAKRFALVDGQLAAGNYAGAQSLNNSIIPSGTIETNWKTVDAILINSALNSNYVPSSADTNNLKNIAAQCPLTGGNIVLKARAILNKYYLSILEYSSDCPSNDGEEASAKAAIVKTDNSKNANQFTLYPNPNNGDMVLEYKINKDAFLEITDISGKLVGKYNLPANSNKMQITNEQVENGVYLYRIVSNGNLIKTGKIIVMK